MAVVVTVVLKMRGAAQPNADCLVGAPGIAMVAEPTVASMAVAAMVVAVLLAVAVRATGVRGGVESSMVGLVSKEHPMTTAPSTSHPASQCTTSCGSAGWYGSCHSTMRQGSHKGLGTRTLRMAATWGARAMTAVAILVAGQLAEVMEEETMA